METVVNIGEEEEENRRKWKQNPRKKSSTSALLCPINNLDDGCLMHIFSFLSPIPDRYNTALVCHRWNYLACHPRLWLRVDRSVKDISEPGVFPNIETAVTAARLVEGSFLMRQHSSVLEVQTEEPPPDCWIWWQISRTRGGGNVFQCALEFLSTCKLANLTVKAELGCCLLHRKGRLTIDGCILQCEDGPLDHLSCPIISTATGTQQFPPTLKSQGDGVFVSQTRIEGGARAVLTSGDLELQRVRVIYARTSVLFWFDLEHQG